MSQQLIRHLQKHITIQEEDEPIILRFFQSKILKKKENLVTEGQICKHHYFVIKGCLRMFFVNDKGIEQTTYFALENWWLTDYMAFGMQAKTEFNIQAIENAEVLTIDYASQEKLLKQLPQLERYFRLMYQRMFSAAQRKTKYMYDFSREELYHHFNQHFPEFVQRIPQYLLASYLGFTPEYLSEIRKKFIS